MTHLWVLWCVAKTGAAAIPPVLRHSLATCSWQRPPVQGTLGEVTLSASSIFTAIAPDGGTPGVQRLVGGRFIYGLEGQSTANFFFTQRTGR